MSNGDQTTWRAQLESAMREAGDAGPVIAYAPAESAFDVAFDGGYGAACGPDVLAWTDSRVYFPVDYDGAESIGSAPRHPRPEGQGHV